MAVSEEQTRLQTKLVEYRRELHENPELSMQEFETTKRIRHWLEDAGITILDYPLEVGVVAEISGGKPGPTIALRADIDALPIKEETGLPFASKNEADLPWIRPRLEQPPVGRDIGSSIVDDRAVGGDLPALPDPGTRRTSHAAVVHDRLDRGPPGAPSSRDHPPARLPGARLPAACPTAGPSARSAPRARTTTNRR